MAFIVGSQVAWSLLWLALFVVWLVLLIVTAVGLYRLGARKHDPGWWALAIGLFALIMFLPFVGLIPAMVVLYVERRSVREQRADWSPPSL